jgi:hypothetical protein
MSWTIRPIENAPGAWRLTATSDTNGDRIAMIHHSHASAADAGDCFACNAYVASKMVRRDAMTKAMADRAELRERELTFRTHGAG